MGELNGSAASFRMLAGVDMGDLEHDTPNLIPEIKLNVLGSHSYMPETYSVDFRLVCHMTVDISND